MPQENLQFLLSMHKIPRISWHIKKTLKFCQGGKKLYNELIMILLYFFLFGLLLISLKRNLRQNQEFNVARTANLLLSFLWLSAFQVWHTSSLGPKWKQSTMLFLCKPLDSKYWTRLQCSQSCNEFSVICAQQTSQIATILKQHSWREAKGQEYRQSWLG